jgi:hypothetical protein
MGEPRYPTEEEFWQRLDERDIESDLRAALHDRRRRDQQPVARLPADAVVAVAGRLVPGAVPPGALAAFLDQHFDQQLGRGDDKAGLMPRAQLIPTGFAVLDDHARTKHGSRFADLPADRQDALLRLAEAGELKGPAGFDPATWFRRTRAILLLGYGSDPRGMVEMGFPGPSYKPGHVWLDEGEVAARAKRRRGYRVL